MTAKSGTLPENALDDQREPTDRSDRIARLENADLPDRSHGVHRRGGARRGAPRRKPGDGAPSGPGGPRAPGEARDPAPPRCTIQTRLGRARPGTVGGDA